MEENKKTKNGNSDDMHDFGNQRDASESQKTKYTKNRKGKKKGILFTVITAFITVAVCIAAVSVLNFLLPDDKDSLTKDVFADSGTVEEITDEQKSPLPVRPEINFEEGYEKEMRGVWIASVGNLNYPSRKGLSEVELKKELDAILYECADVGFNTIFFQVRPTADSLYKSEVFPWSAVLSGTQGVSPDNDFDSLGYLLSKAPDYGIEIHAWVNPFRVTAGSASKPMHDVSALAENHPARLNPEYVIPYADGKLYFDPGNPEVRKLIISGIAELCENYPELAGIHLDDYFYPYPVADGTEFADDASYKKYGKGLDRANFRRNNVNTFVKDTYDTVKGIDPEMRFGISPFGIWANSGSDTPVEGSISSGLEAYSSLYCDALAWVNGGYVDYICPQDYWSFSTTAAPFDNIARWWNAQLDGTGVDLYIGHAAYKAPNYQYNEIPIQVEFARNLISYKGSVFYGYADIRNNSAGVRDGIKQCFENNHQVKKAPTSSGELAVNYPQNGSTTYEASGYILGASDPAQPLTVNGKKISRTKDGYFTLYESFSDGTNTYKLKSGNSNLTYKINKGKSSGGSSSEKSSNTVMDKFEITAASPEKPMWLIPGDTVSVSCTAPAGSKVYATFGEYTVEMMPTLYAENTSKNYAETYKGSVKVDTVHAAEGTVADLGTLTVYAEKNGKKAEKKLCEIKQMGGSVKIYAEVINDYSYLKRSTTSSFYGDPIPANVGMRDYITAFVNGYYRLGCGYYISENDVKVVKDKALSENRINSVKAATDIEDTSNNKKNFTNLEFEVQENVPTDVKVENGKIKITFFNTDAVNLPSVNISANPMISHGSGYAENGLAVYEFTLKNSENYYGFNTVYTDGRIIIRLNNPQTVKDGEKPLDGKTVVVDAGHGGTDMGAQGPTKQDSELNEADLNLAIALELRKKLESLGASVIMTREDDSTVVLQDRTEMLTNIIPDLMISVHHNSVMNTVNAAKARGYNGFYSNESGIMLANAVSDTVTTELSRYQRATSYQALAVVRNHRFPSTLCEMSFISNTEEFQWTITPGNFERSANAIANGVLEFYARQEKYLEY